VIEIEKSDFGRRNHFSESERLVSVKRALGHRIVLSVGGKGFVLVEIGESCEDIMSLRGR
jgi:hypothetical protein